MNRKKFIKIIFGIVFIPLYLLWDSIIKKKIKNDAKDNKIVLKNDFPNGISINGSVIINKNENNLKIFSAKCTHLGCLIKNIENDKIVCPCHGSTYSLSGQVLKGPSVKPLKELDFEIDDKSGNLIIYPS